MGLRRFRSSLRARIDGALDGVPGLISYLAFTSLERRAPALARRADELGQRVRGRKWLAGRAETECGPVDIAYLGSPDRLARWFLDKLGATSLRTEDAKLVPGEVLCDVEVSLFPATEASAWARAGWLVMPRYVRHRQPLLSAPLKFERHIEERVRASGITLRLSRDAADLRRFQRDLYDPMLKRRHGDRALRTGRALLRLGQRRGGLFIAEARGRPVSAAIGAPSAQRAADLEIWALGVAADASAHSALAPVLAWVHWAREHGFTAVDHLASLPLYSDGLTRQKLRWGTVLSEPSESRELLALRVRRTSSAVESWLGRHTFAARSARGITPVDVHDPERLEAIARALAAG